MIGEWVPVFGRSVRGELSRLLYFFYIWLVGCLCSLCSSIVVLVWFESLALVINLWIWFQLLFHSANDISMSNISGGNCSAWTFGNIYSGLSLSSNVYGSDKLSTRKPPFIGQLFDVLSSGSTFVWQLIDLFAQNLSNRKPKFLRVINLMIDAQSVLQLWSIEYVLNHVSLLVPFSTCPIWAWNIEHDQIWLIFIHIARENGLQQSPKTLILLITLNMKTEMSSPFDPIGLNYM